MKALILAAGKGTRLMPLSRDCPKPMLPILDKPVLECLIEHLASQGVDQIIINTSYLAPEIENYFSSGRRWGVELAFSYEGYEEDGQLHDEPLGSAGTIRRIQQHSAFFDDTFIVMCGDALLDLDLRALVAAHHQTGALATLALMRVPKNKVSQYGVAVLDDLGRIMSFQEKPKPEEALSDLINTGVYVFEPNIIKYIPEHTPYDLGSEVFPALARDGQAIYGVEMDFDWIDIGRVSDYYSVQMRAIAGELATVTRPGKEILPGVFVGANTRFDPRRCHIEGPMVIADSVTIEDGATLIGPLYIGRGSIIERNAMIKHSLIFDYTRVGAQASLSNMLVSGRWCALPDGFTIDPQRSGISWILADSRTPRKNINQHEQLFLEQINDFPPVTELIEQLNREHSFSRPW
ncbi:NDP-sugar synthase [Chitinibacter bivalviorum]|uniref:NDP-sugar synthase n=1 Tax=Chitinibacter bivalviorum TaxID=2739434 RepID=A0A7H9BGQ5_9NEIS|nr:NDP-sugar synthase [Chitinibacter bivalviorum]QLG87797.1 NDP-sugar synthase [Chitinibacter bivalviorum]